MKKLQISLLSIFFLTAMSFLFQSCEGNGPSSNTDTGVITLKVRNTDNGSTSIPVGILEEKVYMSSGNNFYVNNSYSTSICDAGRKSLGAVRSVPEFGWAREMAVMTGHTYVVKVRYDIYDIDELMRLGYIVWDENENLVSQDGNPIIVDNGLVYYYTKIHVIDYITAVGGGIIGADVQYCSWFPNK
jgi:hypothetical protein